MCYKMARASLSQVVYLFVIILGAVLPSAYCQNTKWPGTSCSWDNDCKTSGERDTLMICVSNKCACESSQQHFHYGTQNRCLYSASSRCTDNIDLTPHSTCVSRTITCSATYPVTASKTCARTDGEQCANTEDCDQDLFLQCAGTTDKKCACPTGSTFVADQGCQLNPQATCAVKDPLVPGPPVIGCPDHLDCVDKPEQEGVTNLICACAEGLVENGGTCVAPYGAQCLPGDDSKKPCDDSAYLECFTEGTNSTCKCKNSAETVYDANEKICKIQADKGCSTEADQQPCVAFSKCENVSGETKCKCEGNLSALNGKCVLDYGEGCQDGEDKPPCNTDAYQECDGTNCVCSRKDNTWYDGVECRLLESAACVNDPKSQQCIPFAHCNAEAGKAGDCSCGDGLDVSNRRTCTTPNGGECGEGKANCGDFQQCNTTGDGVTSICECEDPDNMKYDTANKACVLKLHSPCVKDDESQPQCEQFSECNEEAQECRCAEGLVEAKDGTCKLSYDEECSAANSPACNEDAFLECSVESGTCLCEDPENMIFDATYKKCVLKLNAVCKPNDPTAAECVEFSECQDPEELCKCRADLTETKDGTCALTYDGDCSKSDGPKCNADVHLECKDGQKCACLNFDNSHFNDTAKSCELNVGAVCLQAQDEMQCPAMTGCVDVESELKCACNEDLTESAGTCLMSYGGFCDDLNPNIPTCNGGVFEKCVKNTCGCNNDGTAGFDPIAKQCALVGGAVCEETGAQRCVTFSACLTDGASGFKCQCQPGYTSSDKDILCVGLYGTECGSEDKAECSTADYLTCADDDHCACLDPDNTMYNVTNQMCELLPGVPCVEGEQACTEMAPCKKTGETVTCACADGLVSLEKACAVAYGGDCDSGDVNLPTCNDGAYEFCDTNKKCACSTDPSIWYENITSTCVLFEGTKCENTENAQSCVRFAECKAAEGTGELKCACADQFTRSTEGTCVGLHDAACGPANDAQCSADNFLECAAGDKCACTDPTSSFYDGKQCVLKVEADCVNDPTSQSQRCTEFSTCDGASGAAGKCACEGGSEVSDEKTCITPYGETCGDGKAKCGKFQDCNVDSNTCLCEDPDNMIFDATHKKCVLKLNAGCKPNDPAAPKCAEFSECQDPARLCKCRSGLTETKDGACALPYDADCSVYDGPKCNADAYLECKDGQKCACLNFDNSYYNSDLQRCQLLIGAACSPFGQECTTTSFCDPNTYKCKCEEGSEASSDGTHCVEVETGAGFGQVCSANGDCNGNAWLICTTNRTCGCSANSWYNPRTSKCELLAGGACNGTQKCTEFSECVAGACACLPNYIPSHDNLCSASFGAACASFDDCSRDAFLVCGPAYTCVCGWYNSWFNPRSGKCELLANEPCAPGSGGQPCTEFSKCDASSGYKCVCDEDFVTTSKHKCAHESCECDDWDVNQESFLLRNSVEKEI